MRHRQSVRKRNAATRQRGRRWPQSLQRAAGTSPASRPRTGTRLSHAAALASSGQSPAHADARPVRYPAAATSQPIVHAGAATPSALALKPNWSRARSISRQSSLIRSFWNPCGCSSSRDALRRLRFRSSGGRAVALWVSPREPGCDRPVMTLPRPPRRFAIGARDLTIAHRRFRPPAHPTVRRCGEGRRVADFALGSPPEADCGRRFEMQSAATSVRATIAKIAGR